MAMKTPFRKDTSLGGGLFFVPNSGNAIFTDSALNSENEQRRSHRHARRPGRIRCRDKRGHSDRRHPGTLNFSAARPAT